MKRLVTTAAGLVALGWCISAYGEKPGPNYEHLKFLEALVGHWKVVTTEGEKPISVGEEFSEWMLNKDFIRHVGWGQHEGENVRYAFCSGWNPKEKKLFQWGFGGNPSGFAIIRRVGTYDAARNAWTNQASTASSDGHHATSTVVIRFVNDRMTTIDFTNQRSDGESTPDHHDTFERDKYVPHPEFGETPGPGYEHLKFLDFSVGKWKLEGELPDGTTWVGEESNEWIFNKNFMWTEGWADRKDLTRVEYELLIGWDPVKRQVMMWGIDSGGGFSVREGQYDSDRKHLACRQTGVGPDGTTASASVVERYVDDDTFVIEFTDCVEGEKPQPNMEFKATRISP